MSDKQIIKKISIPKDTEPKEMYYDDSKGAILFEKKKRDKK